MVRNRIHKFNDMKKIFIFISPLFLLFFQPGKAQDIAPNQVPQKVSDSFQKKFPKVKDVEWERKGNLYAVEFETGRSDGHYILMDVSGVIVRHEEEDISKKDIPLAIINALKANYPKHRVEEIDRVTEKDGIKYKIELENRQNELEVYFTEDGSELQ